MGVAHLAVLFVRADMPSQHLATLVPWTGVMMMLRKFISRQLSSARTSRPSRPNRAFVAVRWWELAPLGKELYRKKKTNDLGALFVVNDLPGKPIHRSVLTHGQHLGRRQML